MRIIKKKIRRGEIVDVDRLAGRPTPPGGIQVRALGTTDGHELTILVGTDREIETAWKRGEYFDGAVMSTTCDDCGQVIKGKPHFGKMNTEDDTKPFIPVWCHKCWKKEAHRG